MTLLQSCCTPSSGCWLLMSRRWVRAIKTSTWRTVALGDCSTLHILKSPAALLAEEQPRQPNRGCVLLLFRFLIHSATSSNFQQLLANSLRPVSNSTTHPSRPGYPAALAIQPLAQTLAAPVDPPLLNRPSAAVSPPAAQAPATMGSMAPPCPAATIGPKTARSPREAASRP